MMAAASVAAQLSDRRLKVSLPECLRSAVSQGNEDIVEQLLDSGILPGPDKEGRTLLHIASQNGHFSVAKALIARSFDVNSRDRLGYTALHRASAQGHVEVVELLLKQDCLVNAQDECGNTPLHAAAWNGCSQTVNLLICNDADVTVTNKTGCTALHLAAQKGHNQCARTLLYAGCSPDVKNNSGETALHFSAKFGHAGIAKILISAKGKLSNQNKAGETALHLAVVSRRQKIAKLLLDEGLSYKTKNKQGESALDLAKKQDEKEMVLLISSYKKLNQLESGNSVISSVSQFVSAHSTTQAEIVWSLKGRLFSLKKRKSVSENFKTAKPQFEDVSDTKSSQSGGLACGRRFQYRACSPEPVSSTTSGVAPSAQYSCDMAPLDLLGSRRNSDYQPTQYVGSTLQKNVSRGRDLNGTSAKFSCNMTPIELLSGFSQHRFKSKAELDKATVGKKEKPVKGLLSEYLAQPGVQYYKDLAGNLKKGPVGYTAWSGDSVEVNTAEELTYERLEDSNHDLCVNTLDRRQQRRQVSLKLRQRSLSGLNGDQGELQPTARRFHREQENGRDHCHRASINHLQSSNKVIDTRYERDAETGVVSRLKPSMEKNLVRRQNSSTVRGSVQVDRLAEDEEGGWMHSTKHHSTSSRVVQQQSVDNVNCGNLPQHGRRGQLVTMLGEANSGHTTHVDGSKGSKQRAVATRQSIAYLPVDERFTEDSSSSDVNTPVPPMRVKRIVRKDHSRQKKFSVLADGTGGTARLQTLTHRQYLSNFNDEYCQMERCRNLLASENLNRDHSGLYQSTEYGLDTPVVSQLRVHRSRSDDTLSTHSRQRRKDRPSKSNRWSQVGNKQKTKCKQDCDLYLIASPINPVDDDDNAEPRLPMYDSRNDLSHPDLLVAAKMRPFWDLKCPASASTHSESPFHSSPQDFSTPVLTRNNVTRNINSFVDTVQSDDSPGSQFPAAPAASPVSGGVLSLSTVSLPPPEVLNKTSLPSNPLQRVPSGQLHSTAECGSNPDSGYDGSKIYKGHLGKSRVRNPIPADYVNVGDIATSKQGVVPVSVPDVVGWQSAEVDTSIEYCKSERSNTNYACYMQNATIDRMIFSPVRCSTTNSIFSSVSNDELLDQRRSVMLNESNCVDEIALVPTHSELATINDFGCTMIRSSKQGAVNASRNVMSTSPCGSRNLTSLFVDAGVQCTDPTSDEAVLSTASVDLKNAQNAERDVASHVSTRQGDDSNNGCVTTNNNHVSVRSTFNHTDPRFKLNIGRSTTV